MQLRPKRTDLKIVLENTGKVILGLGVAMFIPLIIALSLREWKPALDFAISILACFIFGATTVITCRTDEPGSWGTGIISVALSWLTAMVFGAIPLFLSGHFASFLDACFDCMSGLATTGLTLIQDLDHLSYATNFWRHLIMFLGGQGIMLVVLTFFVAGSATAIEMYIGEGREERIFPNAITTARFIWVVSFVYLAIGTLLLFVAALNAGMAPGKGIFHSICVFMAGYDTGGFTPMSQSIIYYHSFWFECATIVIMFLGMINFGVHYSVWTGNRRELYRNVEIRTLGVTIILTLALCAVGLSRLGVYPGAKGLFSRGFYQLISGHSGTGFMTIYGRNFVNLWGPAAFFAVIIAMALGGAACSTSGGIKALRVNLGARAIWQNARKMISPPSAVVVQKYHHIKEIVITERLFQGAMVITFCYVLAYLGGALILTLYRYPLSEALFESTSACANVGLTCGITSPGMPALVKVVFIVQMWAGRLEFMSVFMLFGFIIAFLRRR